jgi:phage-related minor tail protein
MATIANLMVKIGGNISNLEKKMGKAQKVVKGASDKMKSAGKGMTKGVTTPLAGISVAAFAAADDMQKAYDTIQVGTGATGKTMKGLEKTFDQTFTTLPVKSATAATAISNLNTLTGATGGTLKGLTKNVLEASRVLGEDGAANSKAFGQAMQQWQIPAEKGADKVDVLFKATQKYGVGLGEITGHLNAYGSVLQNAGFSMDQSADLFGKLEASGLSVSRLMPGLNMAFRKWADEGKNSQKMLSKTMKKMKEAETSTDALKIATQAFGAEGAQRLVTAVRSGAIPSLEGLGDSLQNSKGLISQTGKDTMTFSDKMQLLKNKAQDALEPLGNGLVGALDRLMPYIEKGVGWAQKLGDRFNNLSPKTQDLVLKVGLAAAAIGPLLIGLGMLTGALNKTIVPFVRNIAKATAATIRWAFLGTTAKRSAVKVVAAWASTAAGAVKSAAVHTAKAAVFVAKWVWMGAQSLLHAGKVAAAWTLATGKALATSMAKMVAQSAIFVAKWVWVGAQSLFQAARVAAAWFIALGPVGWVIATVIALVALIIANWDKVKAVTIKVFGAVWSWLKSTWGKISSSASSIFNSIADTISGVWDSVSSKTSEIWDGIVSTIKGAINGVIGAINGMLNGLSNISISLPKVPDWVPGFGGAGGGSISFPNIPNIPSLATGGVASEPTIAQIGDAGAGNPEIVSPERKMRDIFSSEMAKLLKQLINEKQDTNNTPQYAVINIGGHETSGVIRFITEEQQREETRNARARGE